MHFSIRTIAAVAALVSSGVDAHMEMRIPYPYGAATLNNSPLENNLADFPCKQREGVYAPPEKENVLTVGESSPLEFVGSAVHGGGSCQVSLTEDMKPTKDSVWKVIHSIEGGCPANTPGNLPEDANGNGATKFEFEVPASIKPGEYTLAWTWINRIGNREFYMNCAPVTIEGAQKKRYAPTPAVEPRSSITLGKRDDLPEMFVANINGCSTPHGKDVRYPNPGSSLEHAGDKSNLMEMGIPVCSFADMSDGPITGSGKPDQPDQEQPEQPEHEQPEQPEHEQPEQTEHEQPTLPTPKPGNFAPVESPSVPEPTPEAPAPEYEAPAPEPEVPAPSPPAPSPPAPAPPSSGNGGSALTGPCSEAGMFNCIGGTSFQQCASGQWSAVQQLAQGTVCNEGMSTDLGIDHAKKRHHRRGGHFRV